MIMGSDLQVSSIVHTVNDTFKAYTCNKIVAFYIIVLEVL